MRHIELDQPIEGGVQNRVESPGLSHVAWEAVENVSASGVILAETLANHGDDEVIRDQVACLHDGVGLLAEFCAVGNCLPQHLPG